MKKYMLPAALLVSAAVGCSDRPLPAGPAALGAAALNRGGAPVPVDPAPFVDPMASEICGFPVQVAFGGKSKVIDLPGARTLITSPGFTGTVTNLATGRTETLSITGAFHITTRPDGTQEFVVTGRNIVAVDAAAGGPFYVLASGRFTFALDAAGNVVQPFQGDGRLTDVCGLLS
jgi:hypothetical protein